MKPGDTLRLFGLMQSASRSLFIILILIFTGCSMLPEEDEPVPGLDGEIIEIARQYNIPGVSACAVQNNGIIWRMAWGNANTSNPVTHDTLFMLGSISKTVTGVAFMQLCEEGRIGLDEDISGHLGFIIRHPAFRQSAITPRMLLSHVSGIRDNWAILGPMHYSGGDSPISLDEFIRGYLIADGRYYSPSNFGGSKPGSEFIYTNVGSALIGYLVEVISGESFEEVCQTRIFIPLGMSETSWRLANLDQNHLASPYTGGQPIAQYGSPVYPCGFLRSSVSQFSRFIAAILNNGTFNGYRLLHPDTVRLMMSLHYGDISPEYGLFWEYINGRWGHRGGGPGCATNLSISGDGSLGVIVFTNIENQGAEEIAAAIMTHFE